MVTIQVKRNVKLPVEKYILSQAAQMVLDFAKVADRSELGIVIGNDVFIQRLNSKYRQVDSATDVLAFPSGEVDPDTSGIYLGDVVISLPQAQSQAAAEGHPLADELQLLVVHGTLHLLGYDHADAKDKKRMQQAQDKILHQLRLNLSITL